jgi:hypothetical protein
MLSTQASTENFVEKMSRLGLQVALVARRR